MSLPILPHHAHDVVQRIKAFDEWDLANRRAQGRGSGLHLYFEGTGVSLFRHWPHLLCWQWRLSYEFPWCKSGRYGVYLPKAGASGGVHRVIRIPLLGGITYQRQASDRIAAFGRWRESAPVIWPKSREVANADDW